MYLANAQKGPCEEGSVHDLKPEFWLMLSAVQQLLAVTLYCVRQWLLELTLTKLKGCVLSSVPGFCSCPNGCEASKFQILKFRTSNFYNFSKDFRKLEQELHWRNRISYSYMGRQYLQALHSEESLFTFLDNKNFDTFRCLTLFLAPCTFSVPAKTLEHPGTKQQGFYLGSWWQQLMLPWKLYISFGHSFLYKRGQLPKFYPENFNQIYLNLKYVWFSSFLVSLERVHSSLQNIIIFYLSEMFIK